MTTANIEKFYETAMADPMVAKALLAGAQTSGDVLQRAVATAGEQGLTFTVDEAEAWVDAQRAAKANGELTDFQLEQVAGGKTVESAVSDAGDAIEDAANTAVDAVVDFHDDANDAMSDAGDAIGDAVDDAANSVSNWVKSW